MTKIAKNPVERAFILAAGKGTRLRPYTDTVPKPMVCVGKKPIIDHALEALMVAGVEEVVVNLHHLGGVIESHLRGRKKPKIIFSWEKNLLDTGGGVRNALCFFQNDPFYILNGDALWQEGPDTPALARLARAWDPEVMDILLLVYPAALVPGGSGDYDLDSDGRATRSLAQAGAMMFAGIRIAHPRIFQNTPEGPFSFRDLMDAAQHAGRLYALVHDGLWHHISAPEDLKRADAAFQTSPATTHGGGS